MSNQEPSRQSDQGFFPEIRRARLERLTIYDVEEYELEILARGAPDSIYLNFAIFLLSVAITLTVALLTTTVSSNNVFIVFVICTVVGYILGILLLILWYRNRTSVSDCIAAIRKRLPPEGTAKPLPEVQDDNANRA